MLKLLLPLLLAIASTAVLKGGDDVEATEFAKTQGLVWQFCGDCHGKESPEADVDLSELSTSTLYQDAELAKRLVHVLDTREMPPEDEDQPSDSQRMVMQDAFQVALVEAAKNAGRVAAPIRRMNRFQYNNAVVDLLELDCIVFTLPERAMRVHRGYFDPASGKMPPTVTVGNRPLGKSQMIEPRLAGVAAFPQDLRAEHGFDNRGDHLSLSPLLMEEFLKLGQSITQSPDFGPKRVGIWKQYFLPPKDQKEIQSAIRNRLRPFLTKAFRRPVDEETLQRYAKFATNKIASGSSFTDSMKAVTAAAIASPQFLYLYDTYSPQEAKSAKRAARALNLASRLSFFLWGSLPDDTLLNLASAGSLKQREVLSQQIDRMLADKKLKRFCDSFPSQWLQLDRIVSSVPNRSEFPEFYFSKYRASMHMMLEPLLLFETVLIEDLPITQLLDSDFTYRSGKLQQVYGELGNPAAKPTGGGVTALTYRRTPVNDRRNGGVITNAAVMTMTSGPDRTQPITRGAWIAGVIFNDPPEPPPADVPPLSAKPAAGEEKMTLRERLSAHRERADCRGCHEQIDPLGFALENYDPIGRWRPKYADGLEIDSSGSLFQQHQFSSVQEFKDAILAEKDRFTRALAGHLLSFSLARQLSPADSLALDQIVENVKADDYKMQTLVRQIILSEPFREN